MDPGNNFLKLLLAVAFHAKTSLAVARLNCHAGASSLQPAVRAGSGVGGGKLLCRRKTEGAEAELES